MDYASHGHVLNFPKTELNKKTNNVLLVQTRRYKY